MMFLILSVIKEYDKNCTPQPPIYDHLPFLYSLLCVVSFLGLQFLTKQIWLSVILKRYINIHTVEELVNRIYLNVFTMMKTGANPQLSFVSFPPLSGETAWECFINLCGCCIKNFFFFYAKGGSF